MADTVIPVKLSTAQVEEFVTKTLAPVVEGQPMALVNASFMTIMLTSMGPEDLTEDELIEGIRGMSQWMVMYLTDMRSEAGRAN